MSVRMRPILLAPAPALLATSLVAATVSAGTEPPAPDEPVAVAVTEPAPDPARDPAVELPADATADDFRAAIETVIGPTDDAFATVSGLAPMGTATLPTGAGSYLHTFSVQYIQSSFDDSVSFAADMTLQLAVPGPQLVEEILAAAPAAGLTLDEDTTAENEAGSTLRRLRFDYDMSDGTTGRVSVFVNTSESRGHWIDVALRGVAGANHISGVAAWTELLPLPGGGDLRYGTLSYRSGNPDATVRVSIDYPTPQATTLIDEVRGGLPANGFSASAEEYTGAADAGIELDSDPAATGFTDASVEVRATGDNADMTAAARFAVSVPETPEPDLTLGPGTADPAPGDTGAAPGPGDTGLETPAAAFDPAAVLYAPVVADGATTEQIRDAYAALLGPTDDAVGAMATIAPVLANIPTPADADVTTFSANYYDWEHRPYHSTNVQFTTTTDAATLMTMYADAFAALGLTEDQRSESADGDSTVTSVRMLHDDGENRYIATYHVHDGATYQVRLDFELPIAGLGIVDTLAPPFQAAALLPDGGELERTFRARTGWSGGINFGTGATYPTAAGFVRQEIEAAAIAAGYTIDDSRPGDDYLYVDTPAGGQIQYHFSDRDEGVYVSVNHELP